MNITVIRAITGKWVASCDIEGDKIVAQEHRVGCAVRAVLNTIELKYGPPDGTLTVSIEGW